MRGEIGRLENELKMISYNMTKGEHLEGILNSTFKQIEEIADVREMTNIQLKKLIQKIEVDKEGNVDIYLRLLGDLGLDEAVLIDDERTAGDRGNGPEEETVKNGGDAAGKELAESSNDFAHGKTVLNSDNHT